MSFDPNTFLSTTFNESNDTTVVPVPAGEYLAIAEKVEAKTWSKKDGSATGLKLSVLWDIQSEEVKAFIGRDPKASQDIMLDLTEEGNLDMGKGKNVGLGRLREALDLNTPGQPFSPPMIVGRMAKILVTHEPGEGDTVYTRVTKVAKAS